jgi:hypothetical protein
MPLWAVQRGLLHFPAAYKKPARTAEIMAVRTKVAKSESTPSSPTFAKMAVSAANTADKNAHKNQFWISAIYD